MNNPYFDLYRTTVQNISLSTPMKQAQQMASQMSLMYNAFGIALKDLVHLLSVLYQYKNKQQQQATSHQKQIKQVQPQNIQQKDNFDLKPNQISDHHHQLCNKQIKSCFDFDKYKLNINETIKQDQNHDNYYHNKNPSKYTKTTKTTHNQPKQNIRIQLVRGKRQRQKLNGYSCSMCATFYKALGQDYININGKDSLCDNCSRHRSNLPPTNFMSDFSQEFGFDD